MLQKTQGIVLRPVKYGETSLVVTVFTFISGIQAYMVKGVRAAGTGRNRAAYFQPGTILDMVVYTQAGKNMQHIREYSAAHIYTTVYDDIGRNSILVFSAELLLRLLPEHAPMPALFDFAKDYFIALDKSSAGSTANFPVYFMLQCSRLLGYKLSGAYSAATPYLDVDAGGFSANPPVTPPYTTTGDASALYGLVISESMANLHLVAMNSDMRLRLIDWYIAFLQRYSQHLGNIRSLSVLRSVLH